ncbi:MAG: hypothetical protein RLZZ312_697 [Bacteroidota bacterium]|jgi:hypothetical protein
MKTSNKKWSEMTLEELLKKRNVIKSAAIGLGTVMVFATTVLIYIAITEKKPALAFISIGFFVSLLPIIISISQINKEIKSRDSQ